MSTPPQKKRLSNPRGEPFIGHGHMAHSDSHTEPQRPCPHVSSVHMSQLRSWPHATAAAATSSTDRRHRQCCSCASLTPVAHRMQQATLSRLSDLRAGKHACQMQTSTVGSHEHACTCTASVVAHCAAVPHRCPSAGDSVHPTLPEHVGSDCSATRGSFSTGQSQ